MQAFLMALFAGMLQSGMQSLNGELQAYIGLFGTSLTTHVTGGLLLADICCCVGRGSGWGPCPGIFTARDYGD